MKKLTGLTSLIGGAAMMLGISVTQAGTASETIAQAEADIAAANEARAVWRLVDPATGGKAVPLGKLLRLPKRNWKQTRNLKQSVSLKKSPGLHTRA